MDFANEAGEIRVLKRLIERGYVYRGLKPVYWCFDCGSSLAEFEIEYADRTSTAIDVAFPADDRCRGRRRVRPGAARRRRVAVIWTTTPWTIPANQALNLNPTLEYALVATPRGHLVLRERAGREVPGPLRARGPRRRDASGARASKDCAFVTRSPRSTPATTAARRSTSPTTRPPKTAPASSIRRRRTASTTSIRAARTAWQSTRSSTRCTATASTTPRCRFSAACTSGRPTLRSSMRYAMRAGSSPARRSCTAIRTAGVTRRRSSTAPRRSGSCAWTSPTSRRAACSPSTRRRRRCASARSPRSTRPRSIRRTAAPGCTT